jgi:ABC-type cobalamin/Fe3+-siderophores transport system ATPase subunit
MMPLLVEAQGIEFAYRRTMPVIRHTTLALPSATVGAVVGANGCGKSTLVRLLAGILTPHAGSILFQGRPLYSIDGRTLGRSIAYVPQSTSSTFPFTALEVVLTGRSPHLQRFQFERESDLLAARDALSRLGIQHLENRSVMELSGGERQLVSLARALAQQPMCLLLDEPSASLDLKHRAAIMRLIAAERDRTGLTVLMVTHDLTLIDSRVDVVFAMKDGAITAQGKPAEVFNDDMLREIYEDSNIRVRQDSGRIFVWSDQ